MESNNHAYIKLVPASLKQTITTDELIELFLYYKEITGKTGKQLSWDYDRYAFPYEIQETEEGKGRWFILHSDTDRYSGLIVSVNQEINEDRLQSYIQITLTSKSTHGDKAKANEFCKFLSKQLHGELHLFNNRVMYHYKRR